MDTALGVRSWTSPDLVLTQPGKGVAVSRVAEGGEWRHVVA
jgi:hypothetical protein